MKILTFGEIMLRLKAPGHERFFQSPMLEATFGGGEANVAVSLANYGMDAEFLTVLPNNDIAECCIRELRYFGVDTKKIVRGDGRMGIYYLEGGANQLPSSAHRPELRRCRSGVRRLREAERGVCAHRQGWQFFDVCIRRHRGHEVHVPWEEWTHRHSHKFCSAGNCGACKERLCV